MSETTSPGSNTKVSNTDVSTTIKKVPKIILPDLIDFVPKEDSLLLTKLKRSKDIAVIFLYFCRRIEMGKPSILVRETVSLFKIDKRIVWDILEQMGDLGYVYKNVVRGARGSTNRYTPTDVNLFMKQEFINAAKKTAGDYFGVISDDYSSPKQGDDKQ